MKVTEQFYNPGMSLEQLYMELGSVEYNIGVLQANTKMFLNAKEELIQKIELALSTDYAPSPSAGTQTDNFPESATTSEDADDKREEAIRTLNTIANKYGR